MIIKCPCCEGTGEIEKFTPDFLTPMQKRIYEAVRDSHGGLGGQQLINLLYGDRYDGGPDYPWDSIHVTVHRMNKLLIAVKEQVRANRRGAGAVYRLHRNVV